MNQAKGEVKCLILHRNEFNDLLGGLVKLLEQNNIVRILQSIKILSKKEFDYRCTNRAEAVPIGVQSNPMYLPAQSIHNNTRILW